ncbi:hypothetical protein ACQE98_07355 [Ornithinimicrobium sp. W1679]|uniref:hypothetical protein n=2 Tax=unclassified Ornithinimicrobium TaxID=2615080 RepID=UPI003CF0D732
MAGASPERLAEQEGAASYRGPMVVDGVVLRRWSLTLLGVTAAIVVSSLLGHLLLRDTSWHDVFSYLHVAGEQGIAAYWNSALLVLVAVAAWVSGVGAARRRTRWGWWVVAAVVLFLSIDEATQLHERTAQLVTTNPFPTFPWVVVGIPLAVLLAVVLGLATSTLPAVMRRRLGLALGLYLLGALGFEAMSGYFWRQQRPDVSEGFGTLEEALEMVACIYAAHVVVAALLPVRVELRAGRPRRAAGASAEQVGSPAVGDVDHEPGTVARAVEDEHAER